jgi:exosortase/archaeosortase family protein
MGAMAKVILALEVAAFWPVWIWWAGRIGGDPDAGWSLVALATAVLFACRNRSSAGASLSWICAALVGLYGLSFWFATPIFRAGIAVAAIGIALARTPGVIGLCVIALPVTASLQFVAGFPMRLVASRIASWLLALCGAAVQAEGTGLRWAGGLVEVDVPCSGIRMLWAGLYLALAAACMRNTGWLRTGATVAGAVVTVILGNALRTAGLFYLEAGMLPVPPVASDVVHAGAGLVVFAGIAGTAELCARS